MVPFVDEERDSVAPRGQGSGTRRRRRGWWVLGLLCILAAATAVPLIADRAGKPEPTGGRAGECLRDLGDRDSPKLERVSCTAAEADYKVLAQLQDATGYNPCTSATVLGTFGSAGRSCADHRTSVRQDRDKAQDRGAGGGGGLGVRP
ncbi:LppU/SCO3897 family protein [Streptomyces kaniharaensis]